MDRGAVMETKEKAMKFKRLVEVETEVTHLLADMGVRYWEDASVNGNDEDDENPTIPLRICGGWKLKIDLATGQICGWPGGVTAETHYKVCDAGVYSLLDADGAVVASRDGYVPSMLAPNGHGHGDYVILKIDGAGVIEGWKADLSYFNRDE